KTTQQTNTARHSASEPAITNGITIGKTSVRVRGRWPSGVVRSSVAMRTLSCGHRPPRLSRQPLTERLPWLARPQMQIGAALGRPDRARFAKRRRQFGIAAAFGFGGNAGLFW